MARMNAPSGVRAQPVRGLGFPSERPVTTGDGGIVNRCDRCGDELHGESSPEGLPGPFALPEGPPYVPGGGPEDVRFCRLCLAELSMMGALDHSDE